MPPKFFITHSWKDIEFASRLSDDLRSQGLDGFFDAHSLKPGDMVPAEISRGLEACDIYVPVLSYTALASPWCDEEINAAITLGKIPGRNGRPRIIPILIENCQDKMSVFLLNRLYINFTNRYDDALNELLTKGFGLPPKSPAMKVTPPLPEPKAPAVQGIPSRPVPNAPTATKPRVNRVVLIIGALVAVMILIAGSIVVSRSGLLGQSTSFGIGSIKTAADGAPMMFVPAGEFVMGSSIKDTAAKDDEKPQHTIYLDAFWLDKFEVTNAQYKKCVDAGQCPEPDDWVNGAIPPGKENHPVVGVIWNDAVAYASWAGGRLPTEAEWEKAACWEGANQVKRIYPWGDTFDQNLLNSIGSGKFDTRPVGSYPNGASPYGMLDMAGNVREWTADWYDASYYSDSPKDNPKGPASGWGRVMRGGSWGSDLVGARCTNRFWDSPDSHHNDTGFRVAELVSP